MAGMMAAIESSERELLGVRPATAPAERSLRSALDLMTVLGSELVSLAQALD